MNAEPPAARYQIEDQPWRPGYSRCCHRMASPGRAVFPHPPCSSRFMRDLREPPQVDPPWSARVYPTVRGILTAHFRVRLCYDIATVPRPVRGAVAGNRDYSVFFRAWRMLLIARPRTLTAIVSMRPINHLFRS